MADTRRSLLPTHLRPLSYVVSLDPDFERETFEGTVEIRCDVLFETSCVRLHAKCIKIKRFKWFLGISDGCYEAESKEDWTLVSRQPDQTDELEIKYDAADETLTVDLGERLSADARIRLVFEYEGPFKDDLVGFYQSKFTTPEGDEHRIAVTHMEPNYARRVFPCFDEPDYKATFKISIKAEKSHVALSNMPISTREDSDGSKQWVTFEESALMSTYLVGLLTGPLVKVTAKAEENRIPISAYCTPGTEAQTKFALELAPKALAFFESRFKFDYPLPKLDLAVVPDFTSGAMENWGLIMFRPDALLLDEEESTLDRQQYITDTLLHEISHMWFGNLVTMKFWDGLWLKEGFATLMAWIATDVFYPDWQVRDKYVAGTLQTALDLDCLQNTHEVERVARNPTEAQQKFDAIAYQKGSCVLHMLLNDIGEDNFFKATRWYIERHQYANTESQDFWAALDQVTGHPTAKRMHTWIKEPGHPVITVEEEYSNGCKNEHRITALRLRQKRFIATAGRSMSEECLYPLQISIRSEKGVEMHKMTTQELIIPFSGKDLLKVNADHHGFYRTSYTGDHLQRLVQAAAAGRLPLRDCIGLACDVKSLVAAGFNKTSELLDLSLGLTKLESPLIWELIDRNLHSVQMAWYYGKDDIRDGLRRATVHIIGNKSHELGWSASPSEDSPEVATKAALFCTAGLAGDWRIIAIARDMFARRHEKAIPPHLRYEVFQIVASLGGIAELQALREIWRTSTNNDERYLALECMGCGSSAALVEWVLSHALTEEVKNADLYVFVYLMSSSPHGAQALWTWVKSKWSKIEESVPTNMRNQILSKALEGLGTPAQLDDVRNFLSERNASGVEQVLSQQLEHLGNRIAWSERDAEDVRGWLQQHGYSADSEVTRKRIERHDSHEEPHETPLERPQERRCSIL